MTDLIKRLRSQEAVDAKPHEIEQLTDEAADALKAQRDRIAESERHRNDLADKIVSQQTEISALKARITDFESQLTAKTELATLYAASLRQLEEEVEGLRRDATRTRSITDAEVDAACNAYVRERGTLHEVMRAVIRAARHAALSQTKEQS